MADYSRVLSLCLEDPTQALYLASRDGYLEVVEFLSTQQSWNQYVLQKAVYESLKDGYFEIVCLLATQLDFRHIQGPLIDAAMYGHLQIVKFLVKTGARSFIGALKLASEFGYTDVVQYFFEVHPGFNSTNLEVVRIFLKSEPSLSFPLAEHLRVVVQHNHWEIVRLLTSFRGVDRNQLLVLACRMNRLDSVKVLLDLGAFNKEDALAEAAGYSCVEIVELLLKRGAKYIRRPLLEATKHGRVDVMRILLKREVSLAARNKALQEALQTDQFATVQLLIEHGAS
jgi:ankyrin repeat protein